MYFNMKRTVLLCSREVLYTFVFRLLLLYEWCLLWCVHLHDKKIIKVQTLILAALCQGLFDLWQHYLHRLKVDILSYWLVYINEYNRFWCYSPLLFDRGEVHVCATQHSVKYSFILSMVMCLGSLIHQRIKLINQGLAYIHVHLKHCFMSMSSTYCIDPFKEKSLTILPRCLFILSVL